MKTRTYTSKVSDKVYVESHNPSPNGCATVMEILLPSRFQVPGIDIFVEKICAAARQVANDSLQENVRYPEGSLAWKLLGVSGEHNYGLGVSDKYYIRLLRRCIEEMRSPLLGREYVHLAIGVLPEAIANNGLITLEQYARELEIQNGKLFGHRWSVDLLIQNSNLLDYNIARDLLERGTSSSPELIIRGNVTDIMLVVEAAYTLFDRRVSALRVDQDTPLITEVAVHLVDGLNKVLNERDEETFGNDKKKGGSDEGDCENEEPDLFDDKDPEDDGEGQDDDLQDCGA